MTKLTNQIKLAWLKGMEAVGVSASNMADTAKAKVQEINMETRRREILAAFTMTAFELWQSGEALPAPLESMLKELKDVDEKLSVLRAQKYAKAKVAADIQADVTGDGELLDSEEVSSSEMLPAEEMIVEATAEAVEGTAEAAVEDMGENPEAEA